MAGALTPRCPAVPRTGGNRTLAEPFQFKYGKLPEEFTKPRKRKTIVGVGIELRPAEPGSADAGLFVISDITPGGPAARAGVRPLDRVLAVEGACTDPSRCADAVLRCFALALAWPESACARRAGAAVNELSLGDVGRKLAGTVSTVCRAKEHRKALLRHSPSSPHVCIALGRR